MVTEDFAAVGGPEAITGGPPLPGVRPLGRPAFPNVASRGAPGAGLLLAKGGMAPLPVKKKNATKYSQKGWKPHPPSI